LTLGFGSSEIELSLMLLCNAVALLQHFLASSVVCRVLSRCNAVMLYAHLIMLIPHAYDLEAYIHEALGSNLRLRNFVAFLSSFKINAAMV
jgi:hypothetical protein